MGWGKFSNFINFEVGAGTNFCFVMTGVVGMGFLRILSQIYIELLKIRRPFW